MLRNYKFIIAYDGTRFFGWERQPGRDTIQGKLESVLTRLQGSPVEITGAGRTDAGVHARAMAANAQLDVDLSPEDIRDYMQVSLPVLLNQAQWGAAQMVQTGILGHLGGDVTAANAIAVQAYQVLSVVAYGASSAAGIVVGKTIGAGKQSELKKLVHTLEVLFAGIGILTGLAIFLLRTPILTVFGGSLTERAHLLSMQFMAVIALTTVGTSYQVACDNGIIRGGGDTAFSAKMNLISMWLIIVPLSALAAFRWNLTPAAVFFLLKWDQLYKIIPVDIRLHSWKWVRVVTRGGSECAKP